MRHGETLREIAHRPWPLPDGRWFMGQTWERLLFAHWPVPADALRRVVPAQLPLDTFGGRAWIGVTPFVVRNLRLRGMPPVPGVSTFPEINVRTYVDVGGKPGIYFLSLDADSRPAVLAARRTYRLPYFRADISVRGLSDNGILYRATRRSRDGPSADFFARYAPAGAYLAASPGSLDRWLTERYCLYTLDRDQRVWRGEIHHPPWPLQPAKAEIERNTMAEPYRVALEGDPLLHFSERQDVALWRIRQVRDDG